MLNTQDEDTKPIIFKKNNSIISLSYTYVTTAVLWELVMNSDIGVSVNYITKPGKEIAAREGEEAWSRGYKSEGYEEQSKRGFEVGKDGDADRELYNLALEWLDAEPPSSKQLLGLLFKGWYQTTDITSYELDASYRHNDSLIDMKSIIDDIPRFIVSWRDRLRVKAALSNETPPSITNPPTNGMTSSDDDAPYDDSDSATNSRPLTHFCESCRTESSESDTLYLMMEYLLEVSVPKHLAHHFKTFKNKVQGSTPRSRPQSARVSKPQRWIFFACHGDVTHCYGNLFHTLDFFVPVLVVSYEDYGKYISVCDKRYVVVRLPATAPPLTTGYSHYWVQKLARKLSLDQVWMLDDQVKGFYRTVPNRRVPIKKEDLVWRYDVEEISGRLVSFGDVMIHLEEKMLLDETFNPDHPLSIIGFSNEIRALTEPYYYNIPIGAILLNLKNLKNVTFHPELHQIDTQVLACEAVKSGQRVFVCNSFVLLDSSWDAQ